MGQLYDLGVSLFRALKGNCDSPLPKTEGTHRNHTHTQKQQTNIYFHPGPFCRFLSESSRALSHARSFARAYAKEAVLGAVRADGISLGILRAHASMGDSAKLTSAPEDWQKGICIYM